MNTKIMWAAGILCLMLCVPSKGQVAPSDWKTVPMDASRTGVTIPSATNIPEALGTVEGEVYKAPNGRTYKGGCTPMVAKLMIEAQPAMAPVKEIICTSKHTMECRPPQCELSNLIVDHLMQCAGEKTGKIIDVGIMNFGGIRTDLPEGDILLDDVVSMLPFKNYVTYVELPGSQLRSIFEGMAKHHVEVLGGVELTIHDHTLESALIGGHPIDDSAMYGVATIDFLLDGGDGLCLARNAKSLIVTDVLVRDTLLPYLRELGEAGIPLEYHTDNRVVIE